MTWRETGHRSRAGWKIRALVSSVGGSLSGWQMETKPEEATKPLLTQTTSAAMIHPDKIEELYFSKNAQTLQLKGSPEDFGNVLFLAKSSC